MARGEGYCVARRRGGCIPCGLRSPRPQLWGKDIDLRRAGCSSSSPRARAVTCGTRVGLVTRASRPEWAWHRHMAGPCRRCGANPRALSPYVLDSPRRLLLPRARAPRRLQRYAARADVDRPSGDLQCTACSGRRRAANDARALYLARWDDTLHLSTALPDVFHHNPSFQADMS